MINILPHTGFPQWPGILLETYSKRLKKTVCFEVEVLPSQELQCVLKMTTFSTCVSPWMIKSWALEKLLDTVGELLRVRPIGL